MEIYRWFKTDIYGCRETAPERAMGATRPGLSRNHQRERGPVGRQHQRSEPFDAVEMELIRSDIALLKAEAVANGDWAKWKESQRGLWFIRRPEIESSWI
jgi:hypothetical protein